MLKFQVVKNFKKSDKIIRLQFLSIRWTNFGLE